MSTKKDIQQLIENFIQKERDTDYNPFLSTRIMAVIDEKNYLEIKRVVPLWKLAILAASLVTGVFAGVGVGNLYQTKDASSSIILMNDGRMENFDLIMEWKNK